MLDRKSNPSAPTTVGAYEAKTKFSELIARAEKGESFVVTKNGRPVAEIKPVRHLIGGGAQSGRKNSGAVGRCTEGFRRGGAAQLRRT